MELKDVFGEIEADGAHLVHGRLLEWALTPPLWHAEAVGGRSHHHARQERAAARAHPWPDRVSAQPREPAMAAPMLRRKLSAAVVFVAIVAGPVWLRCWRCRLASGWIAHQPIEIRPRPQHDVILRHELAMIALAYVLPEP